MKSLGSVSQLRTGLTDLVWRTRSELQAYKSGSPSLFLNSMALILARVSQSGLGFLTWLAAARLYSTTEVGIASGVVSAMMLLVQLALFGVGSAIIKLYPRHADQPKTILDTSISLITFAVLIGTGLFLLLASAIFRELSIVGASALYSLLFAGITFFGTLNVLFDFVSIAQRRGIHVLIRNILFGIVGLTVVGLMPTLLDQSSSMAIVSGWVLAGLTACSVGIVQLNKSLNHYRYSPRINRALSGELFRIGIPNYLLTLTERAPAWLMPILVTELLSPTDNAHWYTVWMMAWVVLIVPISVGQNLFAEISHDPAGLRQSVRSGVKSSLSLGGLGIAGIMIMAPFILSLLGRDYADAGTAPLRILSLTLVPATFIQAYYGMCRGFHKLNEATIFGTINGTLSVAIAAWAGVNSGLTGMAVAWLSVQSITSTWAVYRLITLSRQVAPESQGQTT